MSHLNLENLEPVARYMDRLRELYPEPYNHHEVVLRTPNGEEYSVYPPEGRADLITVTGGGKYELFHTVQEVNEYLRKLGFEKLPEV